MLKETSKQADKPQNIQQSRKSPSLIAIIAIIIAVFFSLLIVVGVIIAVSINPSMLTSEVSSSKPESSVTKTYTRIEIIDKFIELYNQDAEFKITDVQEIDIKDKEYYRTEFRLSTFSKAEAIRGKIDGCNIDIVCYGNARDEIRFYLLAPEKPAISFFDNTVKILDEKITDEDISKTHEKIYSDYHSSGDLIGSLTYYFTPLDDNYNVFIDSSHTSFTER